MRVTPSLLRNFRHINPVASSHKMKIAVQGCCHGCLDDIYDEIAEMERKKDYKIDLLLICGDFEAIRSHSDLQCMAVPNKYKELGTFYKYYTGRKQAPILTICIGGNHEASNYMQELYHGGWLAPNIYFLGAAGSVIVNGIRIAGMSGVFKGYDFRKGHFEKLPYDQSSMRSVYHYREYNVRRLSLLSDVDIFLSHDWPQSIEKFGDLEGLVRRKPTFRPDIEKGTLGSPPLMNLLRTLKPPRWFAAHMHVKFTASVPHEVKGSDVFVKTNKHKVDAGKPSAKVNEANKLDKQDVVPPPPTPETKFVALDKCLYDRKFLEIFDLPTAADDSPPTLSFDPNWLAITKGFHKFLSTSDHQLGYPPEREARALIAKAGATLQANMSSQLVNKVQTFVMTAPGPTTTSARVDYNSLAQPKWYPNPQTAALCKMLDIPDNVGR